MTVWGQRNRCDTKNKKGRGKTDEGEKKNERGSRKKTDEGEKEKERERERERKNERDRQRMRETERENEREKGGEGGGVSRDDSWRKYFMRQKIHFSYWIE